MKKIYCLEIATDGNVWFSHGSIYSRKEAERCFNSENMNELAENSTVKVIDNLGNIIFEKSN